MSSWRPWPYAATAIVQHEWDADHLNVWVIFKYPMDQAVKPAHGLWICKVNGVLKAVTVSAWQDEWTILLTVPDVLALPARVTLKYDGPSESLRTTWDKQWEPWGPILSKRIPYLWEGILVVDTESKRVGIVPGVVNANPFAYAFTIVSPDGTDQAGFYHDNTNLWIRWTDGTAVFQTDEGTNSNSFIQIVGKGTGIGYIEIFDQNLANRITLYCSSHTGILRVWGASPSALSLQWSADVPVNMFALATSGEVPKFRLYGRKAGDVDRRHVDLQISPNANNTALWSGVGDYVFDGNIRAVGRLVSGTMTHSAVGPTDDLYVIGVNTVFIDCSLNNVTIGGIVGGVNGQVLRIVRLCATVNDVTLEHNEFHPFQRIFLHRGLDETLTGEYGGWELVCNGTHWFDVSHAKHV